MDNVVLLRETQTIAQLSQQAINAITEGVINPITAHINLSRMEAAIKQVKDNGQVKDITLRELAKYGKKQSFGDCTLEEVEAGVKYDYSGCNDSTLAELEDMKARIDAQIKERQQMLKCIPVSGMVSPDTGEVVYPPAKSSKTTIKTTFKKS
jgi:hypothetical protein